MRSVPQLPNAKLYGTQRQIEKFPNLDWQVEISNSDEFAELFAEFQKSDQKIASNILSERLRRLEERGIVGVEKDSSDARQKIYTATEKGLSLTPVLLEIAAWGASHDPNTGAPENFATDFYADRDAYYSEHRDRIADLFEKQHRS